MKKVLVLLSLAMSILFLAVGVHAEKDTTKKRGKQVTIEERQKLEAKVDELKDINNPDAGFKVEIWTDRKDATYKVGDEIIFHFKTNQDCRLTLFNVGTGGSVERIFPNKHQKDNLVKAGKVYQIPPENAGWLFKAKGPAGVDLAKAIATMEKVELVSQADVKPAGPVEEVTKPQSELAKEIEIALRPVKTKRWAEADLELTVKE